MHDTNAEPEDVDVAQYAGETVRLFTAITRLMDVPEIVEGEVSGTGKTIAVEKPHTDDTVRLDTAEIMAGEAEFRGPCYFRLYTRDAFQRAERSNKAPGPQAGTDEVSDDDALPEPTHTPVGA